MALNLSDPGAIVAAYESIVDAASNHNWLLLKYSNFDELFLSSHGSGGLEELKSNVQDIERVFIAFYREEVDVEPGFALINYIPPSVSGVKKARALVHSRRIGTVFKKHQTTLTVDDLSKLTLDAIHDALNFELETPDSPRSSSSITSTSSDMGRTLSQPAAANTKFLQPVRRTESPGPYSAPPPVRRNSPPLQPVRRNYSEAEYPLPAPPPVHNFVPVQNYGTAPPPNHKPSSFEPVRRAFSESENPGPVGAPTPIAKSASMFSNFIRRKKKGSSFDESDESAPPPTPPKDKGKFNVNQPPYQHMSSAALGGYGTYAYPPPQAVPQRSRTGSLSEFAVISHDDVGEDPWRRHQPFVQSLPLSGKWAPDVLDPTEKALRRQEELRRRKEEEQEALREEQKQREERKRRKEQQLREEMEEEAQRRVSLDDEMRRIAVERRKKEQREREEEERKQQEIEARRKVDRERRMEEHKKLEGWRKEQARMAEEVARRTEEARRREEVERTKKIQMAEAKVKRNHNVDALVTGWVTIQSNDTLLWKRRFYKFMGTTAYFYRSPNDTQQFLDRIELRGHVRGLREWNEGYEDLEAIPHSFALEFKDGRQSWSMYADSEEEKYKLLGLLHHAAGL